jgi:aldose 1-epimerase
VAAILGCATEVTKKKENEKEKQMNVTKKPYGKLPDGTEVDLYTMTNNSGLKISIMSYGATITGVEAPDKAGKIENVALYRPSLADYLKKDTPFFGTTVGRYANRIAKGKFTLEGKQYTLATNDNKVNHIHGGVRGFDKMVWKAEPIRGEGFVGVAFTCNSPDNDQGYPGNLAAKAVYTLSDKDELKMEFTATTDKPTIVNLCNHNYWNLAGAGAGDILGHEILINADRFLPVDDTLIPLGEPTAVKDTPMDFTQPKKIGRDIDKVEGGYDHCYVLNKKDAEMSLAARVADPQSGRVMEVSTTQPGVQFYTANFLDGSITTDGKTYQKHAGFCLETEHFPDSPNHPAYPSTELKPGDTYREVTIHKFSVQK